LAAFLHSVERCRDLRVNPRREVRFDAKPSPLPAGEAQVAGDHLRGRGTRITGGQDVADAAQIVGQAASEETVDRVIEEVVLRLVPRVDRARGEAGAPRDARSGCALQ